MVFQGPFCVHFSRVLSVIEAVDSFFLGQVLIGARLSAWWAMMEMLDIKMRFLGEILGAPWSWDFVCLLVFCLSRQFLCALCTPGTYSVDHTDLEFRDPPALPPQYWEQRCASWSQAFLFIGKGRLTVSHSYPEHPSTEARVFGVFLASLSTRVVLLIELWSLKSWSPVAKYIGSCTLYSHYLKYP